MYVVNGSIKDINPHAVDVFKTVTSDIDMMKQQLQDHQQYIKDQDVKYRKLISDLEKSTSDTICEMLSTLKSGLTILMSR